MDNEQRKKLLKRADRLSVFGKPWVDTEVLDEWLTRYDKQNLNKKQLQGFIRKMKIERGGV